MLIPYDMWFTQKRVKNGLIYVQVELYPHIKTVGHDRKEILRNLQPIIYDSCSQWPLTCIKARFRKIQK